ncbi:15-hydroxyprostaglandin dehydrogenase (NAD(+)) [Sarracenia purpurea var. burkii]
MEIKPGLSALVTGGASGIGKALSLALAEKGVFVTIVDFSEARGKEVAALVEKENAKFHSKSEFPFAVFVRCDVTNSRELSAAFKKHFATYGGLDICINSAGIANLESFYKDQTDGSNTWRHAINVNFIAVIACTQLAIQIMQAAKKPGVIINMGSASGLYPMVADPIYSGSKGGVTLFTRSLVPYKRQGIRINVLCPEFVETEMGSLIESRLVDLTGGFVPMEMVVRGAFELIRDESKAGSCLWITNRRGLEYWPTPMEQAKYLVPSSKLRKSSSYTAPLNLQIPQSFDKIIVHTLSHNFRSATSIVRTPLRLPIKPDHVLVKIIYAGVNASDLAKLAGNTVVATCGGKEKATLLRDLGVDRVIDYKAEDIKTVLKNEFPKGVDIVYESIGGEMFDLCLKALAVYGRLVVIGMISQYQGEHGWKPLNYPGLCEKLLAKSQTLAGFFLVQYASQYQRHLNKLFHLYSSGKLKYKAEVSKSLVEKCISIPEECHSSPLVVPFHMESVVRMLGLGRIRLIKM